MLDYYVLRHSMCLSFNPRYQPQVSNSACSIYKTFAAWGTSNRNTYYSISRLTYHRRTLPPSRLVPSYGINPTPLKRRAPAYAPCQGTDNNFPPVLGYKNAAPLGTAGGSILYSISCTIHRIISLQPLLFSLLRYQTPYDNTVRNFFEVRISIF